MPDKYSNETLYVMLKDMKENMEKGFQGVHDRQDKTNGKVSKNKEDVKEIKASIEKIEDKLYE